MPRPCFHKLMFPSTLQSRQLNIPDNFLRKFGGELSTVATLTVPDGSVWRVGLKKVGNKFWLLDGWQEFVQRYSIGVGYLLVFRYEGKSSFNVHIFNLATSEINYQSNTRSGNEGTYFASQHLSFDNIEDEDSIEFLDSSPSSLTPGALQNKVFAGSVDQVTPGKSYTSPALQNLFNGSKLNCINWGDGANALSTKGANSQDNQSSRNIGVQFNAVEFKRSTEELKLRFSSEEMQRVKKAIRKKRKMDPDGQEPSAQHEEEVEMRYRFYESASARKRTVTAEERERAINLAKAFEPANPFCGGASEASSKSSLLAEMYRPPFEIMCRLPWDEVRDQGKEDLKWILVNVQDPAIFDCQVLNRDIWKNDQIKDTVKENFLFLQYNKDDARGSTYVNYYFQARDSEDAYPHIAIVDPRTGEQVKVWSGPPVPKPMDFLMQLHEFLDRYSLKANARNPIAKRKPESKKKDVHRMTEEEMLEMALQQSMAGSNGGGPRDEDPDELTKSASDIKGKNRASESMDVDDPSAANGASAADTPFARISSTNPHEEPPNDPKTTTRIQFRHAGGREIRRFALADSVRRIYEWLKASPLEEGKAGAEFELNALGMNLIDHLDETIEDVGLKMGTIMVEYV